jgi:NAD(P)H-hydrate epimerase
MRLVSPADVRAADARAAELGVPAATLMEAAGTAVADAVRTSWPDARRPLLLCGPGDNGGDGYVAARALAGAGLTPRVLALDPEASRSEAAEAARSAWAALGTIERLDVAALHAALERTDLVVDALFGSGLDRPLQGGAARVVSRLGRWDGPVLAVDVPSGIDAGRAVPPGDHVRADMTVQLAWACPASALAPARFAFGESIVADIGMPEGALADAERPERVDDDALAAWPAPPPEAHKYQAGAVVIAAGSPRYAGAAELACRGAHRAGAGLVTLLTDAPHPRRWPESIVVQLDDGAGALTRALAELPPRRRAARVLGPGLAAERVPELVHGLENDATPTVVDAAALDPRLRSAVAARPSRWLTPHHGEAARLLGIPVDDVHGDPIAAARSLADAWSCGVVLKSAGAVIAAPDGRVRVVAAGHPAMASGGTGDVLAGALGAALAAPHEDELARVVAAVLAHARAGEVAAARFGRGMRASDLADALPLVLDGRIGRPTGAW